MITDDFTKRDFLVRSTRFYLDKLQSEQVTILEERRGTLMSKHFNVDELIDDVKNRRMDVDANFRGVTFKFEVLKKLRFADMKNLGNAKVYNRPLWGIIFGQKQSLMTDLKYGTMNEALFAGTTQEQIREMLKEYTAEEMTINL
jgi:hypothetical protein